MTYIIATKPVVKVWFKKRRDQLPSLHGDLRWKLVIANRDLFIDFIGIGVIKWRISKY